jgi:hypothetical protein
MLLGPQQLRSCAEEGDWAFIAVRAVAEDECLWGFDARYERTEFPSELLWGPGSRAEVTAWWEAARPSGDSVTYLDRLFLLRVEGGKGDPPAPYRLGVALGLPEGARTGEWHLVQADFPIDALTHVRHVAAGNPCSSTPLRACPVAEVARGPWSRVVEALRARRPDLQPSPYTHVSVPAFARSQVR